MRKLGIVAIVAILIFGILAVGSVIYYGIETLTLLQDANAQLMNPDEISSASIELGNAAGDMRHIGEFASQCAALMGMGDYSRVSECVSAMSDLRPILEQYIEDHPIVDELS